MIGSSCQQVTRKPLVFGAEIPKMFFAKNVFVGDSSANRKFSRSVLKIKQALLPKRADNERWITEDLLWTDGYFPSNDRVIDVHRAPANDRR